jgi:hypothetical protein
MVKGLDIFKKYFEQYPDNYVIIGGTACDIIIDEAGFVPRATKDIDIILVVEALSSEFVKQFWQFIKDGVYGDQEKSNDERQYYRFKKPNNLDFPYQIELFSRTPDVIVLEGEAHLTPIPVDDDLSSLSAILLNDDYYNYMIEHSQVEDGLHHADIEALICLTVMLTPESEFDLPKTIQAHVNQFAELTAGDLPDKAIFKEMGLSNIDPKNVFEQFKKSFRVSINEE